VNRQSYEQWLYVLQLALRILRGEPQVFHHYY